jgi:hypothetical protein
MRDVYFVDASTSQVRVLVRPGELADPFPVAWVAAGAGAVLLAGLAVFLIRRRRAGERGVSADSVPV